MKKKTQKKLLDTLAILAFTMQAAELGIKIWETIQRQKAAAPGKKAVKV